MLRNIQIRNFKAFKEADITLANLNLFTGLNGMGKSSFIQVLLLLRQTYQMRERFGEELMLQGELINIGLARDAFSQDSEADFFSFELEWDDDAMWNCRIAYSQQMQNLNILPAKFEGEGVLEDKSLFNNRFEYLNALRITPEVKFDYSTYHVQKLDTLGIYGQYTFHYLFGNARKSISIRDLKHPDTQDNDLSLLGQVDLWMSHISPGVKLRTLADEHSEISQAFFSFEMKSVKTDEFKPRNVGFGITYVLPVVTAILKAKAGDLVIIENPESHIHPRGQAHLGELFAIAAENGVQLIIETHSDHILNGIRVAAKRKKIRPENVGIFFFQRDLESDEHTTQIIEPYMDENGRLDEWPDNFFDEWSKKLDELMS